MGCSHRRPGWHLVVDGRRSARWGLAGMDSHTGNRSRKRHFGGQHDGPDAALARPRRTEHGTWPRYGRHHAGRGPCGRDSDRPCSQLRKSGREPLVAHCQGPWQGLPYPCPALPVAAKIVPPILRAVARTRSPELFFGVVLAICLGTAALTQAVGLSPALGAFVAGLMISESAYSQEALAHLFPVRDSFVALFFVTLGLLVDPKALISNLPLLAAMVGLILVGKFVIWAAVVRVFGYSFWTAVLVGVGLTQIGEFSFILVQVARQSGLVGPDVYNATLAASLVTILVNAALVRYVPHWIGQVRLVRHAAAGVSFQTQKLEKHVVLCGFGRVGSEIGTALDTFRAPYVVIEVDPDIVETLRTRGIFCLFGDATHERILQQANTQSASLVILTLPEGNKNQVVIRNIRRQNSTVRILARAQTRSDHEALLQAGASEIIQPELEASATMIRHALDYLKLPADQTSPYLERFREAVGAAEAVPSVAQAPLPNVYEFEVDGSAFVDQSLREARIRERFGVTVVALRDQI